MGAEGSSNRGGLRGPGLKKSGPNIPVAGGRSRPSFFSQGRRTTPGSVWQRQSSTEIERRKQENFRRTNTLEYQKEKAKKELIECLEKEVISREKKIAKYEMLKNNLEKVRGQMDRAKMAKKDPFQAQIEIYELLISSDKIQRDLIKEKIKEAKKM